ncbi:unnamed protein product [Caenorhabditis nigoni]
MIANVINVILLGIAISDIMNLSVLVQKNLFDMLQDECTFLVTKLLFYLSLMKDNTRRLSTWLAVLMAFLRYLMIKNALNPTFNFLSKPSFSWKSLAIAFTISSLISLYYLIGMDLISEVWVPPKACGYPINFSVPKYDYKSNEISFSGTESYRAFDGILKIIIVFVLPTLAVLLIRELKKTEVSRKKSSVVSTSAKTADSTSKLVIIMTIICICAEGSVGIAYVIEVLLADVPYSSKFINCFKPILLLFVTLNAITHFFVCLGVSTPYSKAVKEFLRYKTRPVS